MNSWWFRVVLLTFMAASQATTADQSAVPPDTRIAALLHSLERVAAAGEPTAYLDLLSPSADRSAALDFARQNLGAHLDRAVVRERDRQPLDTPAGGEGLRLVVAALLQSGNQGRLLTWELDVRPPSGQPGSDDGRWTIAGQRRLSSMDNLYRLAVDPASQYRAQDLVVKAEDIELRLPRGAVFVATAGGKPTALVLVGKGEMLFSPAPAAERGQVRIFSGSDAIRTTFDACLVRVNPGALQRHVTRELAQEPVRSSDLSRAQQLFAEDAPRSYTLDVGDLDAGSWSVIPAPGDFLAEVHTRRFGRLTYARTASEPEDITLFDRLRQRTIALYASREKLASRDPFFDEGGQADYTVTRYEVTASFAPDRQWIEGRTRLLLRVNGDALTTVRVRLAESLTVRSAVVRGFGRLMAVRARGQGIVLLSLPATMTPGTQLDLTIAYEGPLPPARTAAPPAAPSGGRTAGQAPIEPSLLYTVPVAWYPQPPTTQHAPATLRLTVPAPYSCVASGQLVSRSAVAARSPTAPPATSFTFEAARPVPYLACLITRLVPVSSDSLADAGSLLLTVYANPDDQAHARVAGREAQDIVRFYTSLLGTPPYPALSVTLIDAVLPGGNSPAYLAVLNEQVAMSPLVWRDDPAGFPDFPEFFIAHEIAHQWWGQAVGAKNYHDQWLSEGFAQYFAALYGEHAHGQAAFASMMKRMQGWAERSSAQGPVYLGGRIGQLNNDGRAYRAVVYDKGAVVLHMLRRLIGDQAFFDGLRRFYKTFQFKKAGSDDLRQALEAASGVPLQRFFERWVYAEALPRLNWSWRMSPGASGQELVVKVEQRGEVFDFPVTVTVEYADRPTADIVVKVTDRVVERRFVPAGRVRNVAVNRDGLVPVAK